MAYDDAQQASGYSCGLVLDSRACARLARAHNDANVLVMPARFIEPEIALEIVDMFLSTPFEGGRHERRIAKIPVS